MILRLWLILALALAAAPLRAERGVQAFVFGNSLIWHAEGGDESAMPYWLARMAAAAGVPLAMDGTWGFPADFARALPPSSDWHIDGVARLMSGNPRSFRMAGFESVILAPPNFVQHLPPGQELPDGATVELVRRSFDWAGRQGVRRFLLYQGWADMDGLGRFPPDARAWGRWRDWTLGPYDDWYRDLAGQLRAALPGARIEVIPVARVMAELAEGPLAALGPADLYVDDAPHGTPDAYLLAAMVTWSALTGSAAPEIALPDSIAAPLRGDYPAIAEAILLHTAGAVAPEGARLTPPATGFADPSLGYGLAGISDWSSEMPFLDLMKTARPWIGHLPGQWGGVDNDALRAGGFLSPEGWPLAIPEGVEALESFVLTDLPADADATAGRYVVRWRGEGALVLGGRARDIETGTHELRFSFTPGEGPVALRLTAIDPADPIRDITMIREDRLDLARAGLLFEPGFLAVVQEARMVRFMDWMATNGSDQVTWDDRPRPDDASWAGRGVPVEVMVELANRIGADPWFTLPHMADDDYARRFAQYVHDHLRPGLRAHAEWSNEVWNFTFAQAHWAGEQARARWGDAADGDGWMQFAGTRAAELADIWAGVFADDPGRLVRVVATHTGWPGLETALLDAPLRQAEGLPAPADSFDAYAISGYFGHEIGREDFAPTLRGWIADGSAAARVTHMLREGSVHELLAGLWPHHAAVAAARGLELLMYEGGSHLVGEGAAGEDADITAFLNAYSYGPGMAGIYAELLSAWRDLAQDQPAGPFNAFVDIAPPSRWGSWGARRHPGDVNPRWATLAAWGSLPWGDARDGAFRHGVLRRAGDGGGTIEGTAGADVLIGGAGDDLILGAGGNDLIAGGSGRDRVVLPGRAADWAPARGEDGVLWMTGPQAEVRMVDIEEITFSDEPGAVLAVTDPR